MLTVHTEPSLFFTLSSAPPEPLYNKPPDCAENSNPRSNTFCQPCNYGFCYGKSERSPFFWLELFYACNEDVDLRRDHWPKCRCLVRFVDSTVFCGWSVEFIGIGHCLFHSRRDSIPSMQSHPIQNDNIPGCCIFNDCRTNSRACFRRHWVGTSLEFRCPRAFGRIGLDCSFRNMETLENTELVFLTTNCTVKAFL